MLTKLIQLKLDIRTVIIGLNRKLSWAEGSLVFNLPLNQTLNTAIIMHVIKL